jgi:hypothetical protein
MGLYFDFAVFGLIDDEWGFIKQIITQINKHIEKDRFNHYRPANELVKLGVNEGFLSSKTLDNFERVFQEVNILFENK